MSTKKEVNNEEVKQDTSSVLAILQSNAARKGASRLKNRNYEICIPEDISQLRLAPQAIVVIGIILADGPREINESELFDLIEASELETKQSKWKIFQYYRKPIMEAGFLVESKAATTEVSA